MRSALCRIDGCTKPVHQNGLCGMHESRRRRTGDPLDRGSRIRGDDEARFWSKVDKDGASGCWLWTATKVSDGYGQFLLTVDGVQRGRPAHRHAYELLVGPIPDGHQLDHLCRVRACVNPDHLEPVTQRENVLRGEGLAAINARKTHCKNGHEFTDENTRRYVGPNGAPRRACRACHRERGRRRYAARKAAA